MPTEISGNGADPGRDTNLRWLFPIAHASRNNLDVTTGISQ